MSCFSILCPVTRRISSFSSWVVTFTLCDKYPNIVVHPWRITSVWCDDFNWNGFYDWINNAVCYVIASLINIYLYKSGHPNLDSWIGFVNLRNMFWKKTISFFYLFLFGTWVILIHRKLDSGVLQCLGECYP